MPFLGILGGEESFVNWGLIDYSHPVFSVFDTLPQCKFYKFVHIEQEQGVIASYSNGLPAIIEGSNGKGKFMLFTSSVLPSWSEFYLSSSFVPIIQRAVQSLAGEQPRIGEDIKVGKAVSRRVEYTGFSENFTLLYPDGKEAYLDYRTVGNQVSFYIPKLQQPGIYKIIDSEGKIIDIFAVNLSTQESDLETLDLKDWKDIILLEPQKEPEDMILRYRTGRELWKLFLLVSFGLMVLELLIASRFKR